ncbi:MAG: TolC family protein [Eubacteriales bacterium]|nr:TolC family protein [Eubacteriales bacterium]MDD3200137.1 TolC family protein [Eubacteriales bacterium]
MILKKLITYGVVFLIAVNGMCAVYAGEADENTATDQSAKNTETTVKNVVETVASLKFIGETIDLSLEQALTIAMTSGASIKTAEIQKKSDTANAKSNAESASKMSKVNDDKNSDNTYSKSELDKTRKAKEYYTSMADRNYAAAKNTITYNINNAYYSLLNAKEGVKIARENEQLQKNLLALVNQKLSLGVASKQDVLEAEIKLNNAESGLYAAEVALAEKKMALNIELGYDVMQNVNLTSKLETVKMSRLSVDQAVSDALASRNELYTCAFNIYSAEKELDNYKGYPKNSSKYLNAYSGLISAQTNYKSKEASIKKEVMINYSNILGAKKSADNEKLSVDKAKESYTIYLEKYKLGMVTLDTVQKAQISYSDAEKSYSEAILKYNLAAVTYEMSATTGMSSN